jgi:hypothetical protein
MTYLKLVSGTENGSKSVPEVGKVIQKYIKKIDETFSNPLNKVPFGCSMDN